MKNWILLFERLLQPVFIEKGQQNKDKIPSSLLIDRSKDIANPEHNERILEQLIANLTIPIGLGHMEQFSHYIPRHQEIAARIIDIFMGLKDVDELHTIAAYVKDRVNPYLFYYTLQVAILHRPDTQKLKIEHVLAEHFPEKFVDSKVFHDIRKMATVAQEGSRTPIVIPIDYTASGLEPEHRLWYFREDIGINLHHWHWHLVYPFEAANDAIVNKDRRGELFYFMHQQIVGRYNFERFSNYMPRVLRFSNLREPIAEGYFPKMDSMIASRAWPSRPAKSRLSNLNRNVDQLFTDLIDLEIWIRRFKEACHQGYVIDESGSRINLDDTRGIDILGNIMESSTLSVNRKYYGSLHNLGHMFISYAHDPDHRHLEPFGVMGDSATAMRDPIFYRWHAFIDDLFQEHKQRLPSYTAQQLDYAGIRVEQVSIQPENGPVNSFQTFWQQSDLDFSRGLDFFPRGNVLARFTHLQHSGFTYRIQVNNANDAPFRGTCRIFMAPSNDEHGTRMLFRDQRLMMIEMDKFPVTLDPGTNTITRPSTESSVTIPFERTFRDVDTNRPPKNQDKDLQQYSFCGCGWPQHMLVPKGLPGAGLSCDLFVMISNYQDDAIEQDLVGTCNDAFSFCGVRDRLYPDRRSMGFPFDRLAAQEVDYLQQFLKPNMFVIPCSIVHTDRTVQRDESD